MDSEVRNRKLNNKNKLEVTNKKLLSVQLNDNNERVDRVLGEELNNSSSSVQQHDKNQLKFNGKDGEIVNKNSLDENNKQIKTILKKSFLNAISATKRMPSVSSGITTTTTRSSIDDKFKLSIELDLITILLFFGAFLTRIYKLAEPNNIV